MTNNNNNDNNSNNTVVSYNMIKTSRYLIDN